MSRVFIIGGKRTPVGNFMGIIKQFKGVELAALALIDTIKKFNLNHHEIEELILGNAISAGMGQNPARQISFLSRINSKASCYIVSNGTSSGIKAINIAANNILTNQANFVMAGGFESLSNVPQMIRNSRSGIKYGDTIAEDPISTDVMINPENKVVQGFIVETIAKRYMIDKTLADEYAKLSYQRAITAMEVKKFDFELSSIKLAPAEPSLVDELYHNLNPKQIELAQPIYMKNRSKGIITTLNTARFADGACIIALASETYCKCNNAKPIAQIIACNITADDPLNIIETTRKAVEMCLDLANVSKEMIAYWEINEDYASTVLILLKSLNIHFNKVNIHGGSISIGNPFAMTSARIVLSMVNILKFYKESYGCVVMPNEDGCVTVMVLRNCN